MYPTVDDTSKAGAMIAAKRLLCLPAVPSRFFFLGKCLDTGRPVTVMQRTVTVVSDSKPEVFATSLSNEF